MIVDVISTDPPPSNTIRTYTSKNAPSFREDTSSRRAVVTSRTDGKSCGKDIHDSNTTTGLMRAADESTNESHWECNPVSLHKPDGALNAHRDFVHGKCDSSRSTEKLHGVDAQRHRNAS